MASMNLHKPEAEITYERSMQRSSKIKSTRITSISGLVAVEDNVQRCMTNRQRGIIVTMLLFATITSAQYGAAIIAQSLALLGDCASMTVDTFSYGANLYAECVYSKHQRRNHLIATAVSISVLLGITGYVIYDSLTVLLSHDSDDDDVNAQIVFAFGLGGLLFDLLGLLALWLGKKEESTGAGDLNLYSAGMHVIADLMRSTTTVVESILIWFCNYGGGSTDATAALIVSALILIPCAEMIREWVGEFRAYRSAPKDLSVPLIPYESNSKQQDKNDPTNDYSPLSN